MTGDDVRNRRVGISGHQILPPDVATLASHDIMTRLTALDSVTGVSSLAQGADQLFATCVLAVTGSLEVIVPSFGYETTFSEESALRDYERLLAQASRVTTLAFAKPTENAFLAAGKAVVDACEVLYAVWDGQPARGSGGTADIVEYARQAGRDIVICWPAGFHRQ